MNYTTVPPNCSHQSDRPNTNHQSCLSTTLSELPIILRIKPNLLNPTFKALYNLTPAYLCSPISHYSLLCISHSSNTRLLEFLHVSPCCILAFPLTVPSCPECPSCLFLSIIASHHLRSSSPLPSPRNLPCLPSRSGLCFCTLLEHPRLTSLTVSVSPTRL